MTKQIVDYRNLHALLIETSMLDELKWEPGENSEYPNNKKYEKAKVKLYSLAKKLSRKYKFKNDYGRLEDNPFEVIDLLGGKIFKKITGVKWYNE